MLNILGGSQRVCSGLSRRQWLQAGGAGLLGLSLPKLLAAEAASPAASGRGQAKSVIFVFLFGGPSQLETFDLKPDAPSKIRGPFKPIASRTPGMVICEHLPRLAATSDQFCIVRSVTHNHNDHNACHLIQTGHPFPRVAANGQDVNATDKDWPAMGSVVEYMAQREAATARDFPSYVYLPNRLGHLQGYDRTGQYGGWLGRGYDALATDIRARKPGDNPYYRDCTDDDLDFRIKGLVSKAELTIDRINQRQSLLEQFNAARRGLDRQASEVSYDRFQQRAFTLVTSEKIRTALDIRQEPAALRDRYGRHLFGQAALMGRRMVEAGARFVTLGWDAPDGYGWDSHIHSRDLEKHLLPALDQSLSALLADLAERGRLQETLVVCFGEMGRSPQATDQWGRGHWSFVFPALLAGGGIRGGALFGRSDKDAAWPVDHPVGPADLAAAIFHALGIDPELRIPDPQGRPVALIEGGRPLFEIFG
jgi:hypothetical protein